VNSIKLDEIYRFRSIHQTDKLYTYGRRGLGPGARHYLCLLDGQKSFAALGRLRETVPTKLMECACPEASPQTRGQQGNGWPRRRSGERSDAGALGRAKISVFFTRRRHVCHRCPVADPEECTSLLNSPRWASLRGPWCRSFFAAMQTGQHRRPEPSFL
jgi:hypothetical protein